MKKKTDRRAHLVEMIAERERQLAWARTHAHPETLWSYEGNLADARQRLADHDAGMNRYHAYPVGFFAG